MATTLEQLTYELTQNAEGFNGQIHYDSKGIATLGSGVALIAYDADAVGNKYTMMETIGNVSIKRFLEIVTGNESVDSLITILKNDEDTLNQGNGHISSSSDFGINISLDFFISHIWGGEVGLYETYLNRSKHILDNVNTSIYPSLSDAEKAVVFSLTYTGAMGSNMARALEHYISADATERFIGKMSAWYEILYHSNNNTTVTDRPGQQNRRFMEANTFLTGNVAMKPTEESAESVLDVNSYEEAKLVVAFMNSKAKEMIDYYKSGGFRGYSNRSEEIVRKHFSFAVSSFLVNQNFTMEYNTNTLFQDWNLLIDLNIDLDNNGRPTGTTSYRNIEGSDVKDLIFITAEQDGIEVRAGSGDDFVGGSGYSDVVYSGSGNDIIYTYGGNDIVDTTDSLETDYNKVYLGAGSDIFVGGDGNDEVDGGNYEDTANDINNVDLGGGQNRYIGSVGKDIVSGSGYNTVYLGAGSDEYYGGDGVDIVDGGTSADSIIDKNVVYLFGGDDQYKGGDGQDIVYGGSGNNTISLGRGSDEYYGGDDVDTVEENTYSAETDINKIYLRGGNDSFSGGSGRDIVYGGTGDDYLGGGDGKDELYGEDGIDIIRGGAGSDILDGGDGDDKIYGDGDSDILIGGKGNDYLEGGVACSDTYVYNLGDGLDRIYDYGDGEAGDIIKFGEGISYNDFEFKRKSGTTDLYMLFKNDSSQGIILESFYAGPGYTGRKNKTLEFADGSSVNLEDNPPSLSSPLSISSQNASDLLTQALSTFGVDSGSRMDMSEAGGTVSEMYDLACGYDLTKKVA